MPFKKKPQVYNAQIKTVTIGGGEKAVTIGGQSALNLYTFDAEMPNAPKIGAEISDIGYEKDLPELTEFYAGCGSAAEMAKKAAEMDGADFICVRFYGADPNGLNRSAEECVQIAKEVAEATDMPLVFMGCDNPEKDAAIFGGIAEALTGKNVLVLSAVEENYKAVGAAAGLAYGQKVGAESAVDINLAKQLNILLTQLGVSADNVVMNIGSAAVGYGYEYIASTLERIKSAALSQNDAMLQMPIITPVSGDAWDVKEATASEEDMPEWGPREERGIGMEIATAAASLAYGADAVIMRHPRAIAAVSAMVKALM